MPRRKSDNMKKLERFFEAQEKRIVETQSRIAEDVMDTLFDLSPHIKMNENQANSEYDANHKISINEISPSGHHPATFDESVSRSLIEKEKAVLEYLECGDTVTISNDTSHALDVEFGNLVPGNYWKKSGYAPYTLTKAFAKGKWGHVIK